MEEFVQLKVATYNKMRDDLKEYERATSDLQDELYEVQRGAFEWYINTPMLLKMEEADWQHEAQDICNHLIIGGSSELKKIHVDFITAVRWLKEDYNDLK